MGRGCAANGDRPVPCRTRAFPLCKYGAARRTRGSSTQAGHGNRLLRLAVVRPGGAPIQSPTFAFACRCWRRWTRGNATTWDAWWHKRSDRNRCRAFARSLEHKAAPSWIRCPYEAAAGRQLTAIDHGPAPDGSMIGNLGALRCLPSVGVFGHCLLEGAGIGVDRRRSKRATVAAGAVGNGVKWSVTARNEQS
eukprot:923113-Pleurochrysis_carterae.AAC.4